MDGFGPTLESLRVELIGIIYFLLLHKGQMKNSIFKDLNDNQCMVKSDPILIQTLIKHRKVSRMKVSFFKYLTQQGSRINSCTES